MPNLTVPDLSAAVRDHSALLGMTRDTAQVSPDASIFVDLSTAD